MDVDKLPISRSKTSFLVVMRLPLRHHCQTHKWGWPTETDPGLKIVKRIATCRIDKSCKVIFQRLHDLGGCA